jgi:CelD/BcsL family acetyltransferase involved in cellulose biosynthesis
MLVRAQASRGRVRFIRIVAGEAVVAEEYAYVIGDRYYAELTARASESQWDRFSLGPTSTVRMLAHGIAERMTRVESGLGHYDYKVRLGAQEHAAVTFRLVSSRLGSRIRVAFFSVVRDGLRFGYLKVWYRRIVPRLPQWFWRPQHPFWLRLDF